MHGLYTESYIYTMSWDHCLSCNKRVRGVGANEGSQSAGSTEAHHTSTEEGKAESTADSCHDGAVRLAGQFISKQAGNPHEYPPSSSRHQ